MNKQIMSGILEQGKPDVRWDGEPMLGSWYTEEEVDAITKAVRSSMDLTEGFGFICDEIVEFERMFSDYCGTSEAVSITSAGAGLDMAMRVLDLQPGDEVIAPAINFHAGHYSVLGHAGRLVFCEVDPSTLNADPADVERRVTPRTRAILVTHMNGLAAPMDDLLRIAEDHAHPEHGPIKVIGDAARACGAEGDGARVGKKGWMTIFSFHTMKLMTTLGEGGMITTDDPDLAHRLRGIRMWGNGTEEWGGNYKMTKIQAAVGIVQLKRLEEMIAKRIERGRERSEMLGDIPELILPYEPPGYRHVYYLYTCLVPREWQGEKRDKLIRILNNDYGVGALVLNKPTYLVRPYVRKHTLGQNLPLSEELGERLFCPSLHPLMTSADNAYITAALSQAVEEIRNE